MSYTQRFEHDVFVSYAHLDNEPTKPGLDGWVRIFVDRLKVELRQRLGSADIDVWMDSRLEGNQPLSEQLYAAAENSATLLVVLSPSYLESRWCMTERERFLSRLGQRKADGTIFVAQTLDVTSKPPELADLVGYSFWATDKDGVPQRLGMMDPRDDARFIERISQISYSLKEKLVALKNHAKDNGHTKRSTVGRRSVYVARATDDLIDQEESLRSYLMQQDVRVVLGSAQSLGDPVEFERQARADVENCGIYVQLLSASRGRSLVPDGPRLPVLLATIAKTTSSACLFWRSRELDMNAVTGEAHRKLLEEARACGFEEFKRAVLETANASKVESKPPRAPGDSSMVFVNAEDCDRELAKSIGRWLAEQGVDCYWPLTSGSPEHVRLDYEDNLLSCDGILWVYGKSDPGWVVAQLRRGRRVLGKRERPVAIGIVEGPPPEKGELPAAIPDLSIFNCRDGIEPAVLGQFIERVKHLRTEV